MPYFLIIIYGNRAARAGPIYLAKKALQVGYEFWRDFVIWMLRMHFALHSVDRR